MYRLIIAGALLAAPTLAAADGYEGSTKDTGYVYSYSVKQSRGGWECPREFSRKECSKLRQVIATRRAREDRPRKVVVERRVPVIRDTVSRAAFGGKRCLARVEVAGVSRPTEGLARGNAWKRWRETVRAANGEQYMDNTYAIGERVRCHIASSGGWTKRCIVSAVPCR